MLEIVKLGPKPTTPVMVGLAFGIMAADGSAASSNIPIQRAERPAVDRAAPHRNPTFSYFEFHNKELPQAFVEPYREMLALKSLKDGWDGEQSRQISNGSVDDALAFLALLPSDVPAPEASAASDGTVDWYWRKDEKAATVTFYSGRKAAYFALTDNGSAKDAFTLSDKIPAQFIESLRQL